MFSEAENFCRNLHFLLLTETDGNGQLNISMQQLATSFILDTNMNECNASIRFIAACIPLLCCTSLSSVTDLACRKSAYLFGHCVHFRVSFVDLYTDVDVAYTNTACSPYGKVTIKLAVAMGRHRPTLV